MILFLKKKFKKDYFLLYFLVVIMVALTILLNTIIKMTSYPTYINKIYEKESHLLQIEFLNSAGISINLSTKAMGGFTLKESEQFINNLVKIKECFNNENIMLSTTTKFTNTKMNNEDLTLAEYDFRLNDIGNIPFYKGEKISSLSDSGDIPVVISYSLKDKYKLNQSYYLDSINKKILITGICEKNFKLLEDITDENSFSFENFILIPTDMTKHKHRDEYLFTLSKQLVLSSNFEEKSILDDFVKSIYKDSIGATTVPLSDTVYFIYEKNYSFSILMIVLFSSIFLTLIFSALLIINYIDIKSNFNNNSVKISLGFSIKDIVKFIFYENLVFIGVAQFISYVLVKLVYMASNNYLFSINKGILLINSLILLFYLVSILLSNYIVLFSNKENLVPKGE